MGGVLVQPPAFEVLWLGIMGVVKLWEEMGGQAERSVVLVSLSWQNLGGGFLLARIAIPDGEIKIIGLLPWGGI